MSWIGWITFSWVNPFVELAQHKPIQLNDIPKVPQKFSCEGNISRFIHHFHAIKSDNKTIFRVLLKIYGLEFVGIGVYYAVFIFLSYTGPVFLDLLVTCLEESTTSIWTVASYIGLFFISRLLMTVFYTRYAYSTGSLSIAVSTSIKGMIYHKTLRLSTQSKRVHSTGSISNLYTVDVERIVSVTVALHNLWALPLQIILCMILLYEAVSTAMFAGLSVICVLLIINHYVSRQLKRANDQIMIYKDQRMRVTAEALHSILNIKLNSWSDKFRDLILNARSDELKYIWSQLQITAINIGLLWFAPCAVSVATICVYVLVLGENVTAARIFTALALFRMLQSPLRELPSYIAQLYQCATSAHRLEEFFAADEKDLDTEGTPPLLPRLPQLPTDRPTAGFLRLESACSFAWYPSSGTLATDAISEEEEDEAAEPSYDIKGSLKQYMSRLKTSLMSEQTSEYARVDSSDYELPRGVLSGLTIADTVEEVDTVDTAPSSSFRLTCPTPLLIRSGELVLVVGPVGCGKSSLLLALLGEMYGGSGPSIASLAGRIGYSSQQAW